MTKSKILALAACAALAATLGLAACGNSGSGSTETSATVDQAAENTSAAAGEASMAGEAGETVAGAGETSPNVKPAADRISQEVLEKLTGYTGTTEDGKWAVWYAESPDLGKGEAVGVIVIKDADDKYRRYVGAAESNKDGKAAITDEKSGEAFKFIIADKNGKNVTLDLGKDIGTVKLAPAEMKAILEILEKAGDESPQITQEAIEALKGYSGVNEDGELAIWYAESPDLGKGKTVGVMVIKDENDNVTRYVGIAETADGGKVAIADEMSGETIKFAVVSKDANGMTIDLGEAGGIVELVPVEMSVVLEELGQPGEGGPEGPGGEGGPEGPGPEGPGPEGPGPEGPPEP